MKEHTDSINAVLVLTNGTVPRGMLATLSAISPSRVHNVAFIYTNVSNPLYQNFPLVTVPHEPRDAPQFALDNPIALQREYLKVEDIPKMKEKRVELRKAVKASEENALHTLAALFDWLDGLERSETTEIATGSQ